MCLCDLYCTSQLLSMKKADACGCPIIIANDPDADRLAVAEKLPRYTPGYATLHWGGSALLSLFIFIFFKIIKPSLPHYSACLVMG